MMDSEHWNERYAATDRLFIGSADETLVELAGDLASGRALDAGAGEGRNSLWLARRGWSVTAIDVSEVALARLAEQARDEQVSIATEAIDVNQFLERGEQFDLVVIANVHMQPAERELLFARASDAVAPGGHLFLVGHHLDSLGHAGPPQADRLYTEETLTDAFPRLEVLRLEQRNSRRGDRGAPTVDVFLWAVRPR